MTIEDYIAFLNGIPQAIQDKRVMYFGVKTTMVPVSDRIWGRGELTSGARMTYKDDYALYAYKPPSPVTPTGKGKTGKPIKGGYYPNYSAYKAQQGRPNLPFELTGDLRKAWLGGEVPDPVEVTPLEIVIQMDEVNTGKADGLTATKGEFLVFNENEKEILFVNVNAAYKKLVLGL